MPRDGLVAWGLRRFAHLRQAFAIVAFAAALPVSGCGEAPEKHKAVECRSDDDCESSELGGCEAASCVNDRCEVVTRPDGERCDDTDPLTGDDACLSGVCAGIRKECEDDLGPCLQAVYDSASDECVVEPVADEVPCDDQNACTQRDSCLAGECVGAEPKTCAASDACHVAGECDPESGECVEEAAPDGTACDDGRPCTVSDGCASGRCAGEAVVCDDGLSCSSDSCDDESGACASDMARCSCVADEDCNDGNACNGSEVCNPSTQLCQAGTPTVCAPTGDACLKNTCVPETGACEPEPVPNGTVCDDANACTGTDACEDGVCIGSDAVVCTALNQCHTPGTCDEITGQCSNPPKPNDASCSDGNACTTADTCQAGACVGAGPTSCAASDQCHDAGVCNVRTGACSNPSKPNGVSCNDGNACTQGDSCQTGVCTPAARVVCSALDSCHNAGVCDTTTGICSNPAKSDGSSCNDGLTCTTADKCTGGKCGGSKLACNDQVACTADSCSEQLGGCTIDSSACACKTSADCNDGNPCNGVEVCNLQTLQCQRGNSIDCTSLDDACNVGVCSAATGACTATPKQNGTACDDGNSCTQASSCQAGVCKGSSPVICAAADQCHEAGSCNPATGKCSSPAKSNGSACNDGSACTKTDTCQAGVCSGSDAVVCTAKDQCHVAGVCDKATGVCDQPAKSNGASCSDGSLCTQTDSCQGGVCVGASPVTCAASDQCHGAGSCDPATGTCSNPPKKDGSSCSDGSLCTRTDTCQKGVCTGASPVTCTASDQCHTAGSCAAATGKCSNPAKKDGAACADGSLCTQTDTCQAGVCKGENPIVCSASDQCHDAGSCDAATGKCSNPAKPDSTPCNDGKACTGSDKCVQGVCGGAAVGCNDGVACTADSCGEPNGCTHDQSKCGCAKDSDCNDGNACNGVETCNSSTLSCVAGKQVSCTAFDDACNVGVCDAATGACRASPRPDGTGCNDGNACTKVDGCAAGKCVGSSPVKCTASDQCHDVGVCDAATGVCSNPSKVDGSSCNDGNACTKTDACKGGACAGSSPVVCAASDQCHSAGTCDPASGLCSNPVKKDGSSCSDGSLCTQTDTCQVGVCVGSNPVVCAASDQCHEVGTCVSSTGKCTSPVKKDGTKCDDGDLCTRTDTCQTGACKGQSPVVCTALGQCYRVGSCDPQTGLCSNPLADAATSCSDGSACTTGDKCDGQGNCAAGSAVVCPVPTNPCQTNACNVTLGCQLASRPAGTRCDDGSACTQVDACSNGACAGGDPRANVNGDWSDDPGGAGGPSSVDVFTDKEGRAHIAGIYRAAVLFNDKDAPKTATVLPLPLRQTAGIYWAIYEAGGAVAGAYNIGGGTSTLTVSHAAGHRGGGFTLIGVMQGTVTFGRDGTATKTVSAATDQGYVAHYQANGTVAWVAQLASGSKVPFSADSVSAFDDGSVVVAGTVAGPIVFQDANGKRFAQDERSGVWAARFDSAGIGQWGKVVVLPEAGATVQAVAALDDGGAALTGAFAGTAKLGSGGEVAVSVSQAEQKGGRDLWFLKLDKESNLAWGGRVGSTGVDVPGDVERIDGGSVFLLANTVGDGPNADDAKTSQPLFSTSPTLPQAHVIHIDASGTLRTAGLIADEKGGARGYQLDLDMADSYAVAGVFAVGARFWGKVGFGSGSPPGAAQATLSSLEQGPSTLFVARTDATASFPWAAQARGDKSGMISDPWDIVLTGHPSHALTVAGMFKSTAYFGDGVPEQLQAVELGNPFVVHLNSEAEYDYCE